MVEPNRLRGQVRPSATGYVAPARWPRGRAIGVTFIAELLLIPGFVGLFASGTLAAAAMIVWVLGHLILGAWVAAAGGGGRTWPGLVVGQLAAGVLLGAAIAVGYGVGVLPVPETWDGPGAAISYVALIPLLVLLFGAPITLLAAVLATGRVQLAGAWRHWSVAKGRSGWLEPEPSLEQRSTAWEPLDDVGLAKATANGAASTVIRAYPVNGRSAEVIRADERTLATIGYRMTALAADAGRQGVRAELTWVAGFLLGLVGGLGAVGVLSGVGGLGNGLDALRDLGRRMRDRVDAHVVVTYSLESGSHAPIELPPDDRVDEET